ncbi:MFS transporter [Propionicimonas sp.]|uniref:MFS transporter n=1 Tax=Propionicimonas sp. TaxID=1955623 RepID=UPI0039E31312
MATTEPAVSRPVASARAGDLVVFAVNGFAFASWMSRVPDVKESLALTPGLLAILLLSVSIGSLLGLPAAGRIAHRIGAANTVRLGMVMLVPGIAWAGIAVQAHLGMYLVMPGLFLLGMGSGIWDVAQNLEGTIVERALGRAIMPWFHAAFSGGTVLAALIGAGLVWLRVPVAIHLGVVAALTAVAVLWGTARFLPAFDEDGGSSSSGAPAPQRSAWREPRTLLIGLMVLAAAFAEGTANDWMAVAFVDGHGLDNALGVVALAVFLSFMTAGRVLGTGLLDRHGRVPVLRVLFGAAILGCVLVVFGNTPVAFVGCAIWGLGASMGFPVGMSAAADDPARAPLRLSVVSTLGYTAFLAGPPLLGFLGDHYGVLRALLVVGVVSVLALLVVPAARPPANAPSTPEGAE